MCVVAFTGRMRRQWKVCTPLPVGCSQQKMAAKTMGKCSLRMWNLDLIEAVLVETVLTTLVWVLWPHFSCTGLCLSTWDFRHNVSYFCSVLWHVFNLGSAQTSDLSNGRDLKFHDGAWALVHAMSGGDLVRERGRWAWWQLVFAMYEEGSIVSDSSTCCTGFCLFY